jgi:hypothetical protein
MQGTIRRRLAYLIRATPAANTPAAGDDTPAPAPAGEQDKNPDADNMTEMKAKTHIQFGCSYASIWSYLETCSGFGWHEELQCSENLPRIGQSICAGQ